MLKHHATPMFYWPFAINTSCHVLNRIPKDKLMGKSPEEAWTNEFQSLDHLRTFCVEAWVRVHQSDNRKGGNRAKRCIFLGYKAGLKGYMFKTKDTGQIITSGDATFHEGTIHTVESIKQLVKSMRNEEAKVNQWKRRPTNSQTMTHDDDENTKMQRSYDDDASDDDDTRSHNGNPKPNDDQTVPNASRTMTKQYQMQAKLKMYQRTKDVKMGMMKWRNPTRHWMILNAISQTVKQ